MRAALAVNPKQPELWGKLAQAEAAARRIDAAIAVLYEGLSHCPEHPASLHALVHLASVLHQRNRFAEALSYLARVVRTKPARPRSIAVNGDG